MEQIEKIFKIRENHTTVKTEIIAGLTTFMTMAYIIALNPNLLTGFGAEGQNLWNGVFLATCIASFIGMMVMAFVANKPFAINALQTLVDVRHQFLDVRQDGRSLPHEHTAVPQIPVRCQVFLGSVQIRLFHKALYPINAGHSQIGVTLKVDIAIALPQ